MRSVLPETAWEDKVSAVNQEKEYALLICQLNNTTDDSEPENLVRDNAGFNYYKVFLRHSSN